MANPWERYGTKKDIGAPIDTSRPKIQNADGSFSTERTITVGLGNKFYNIPTIIDGKEVSPEEAITYTKKTGKHLGVFDSEEQAISAAQNRTNEIGKIRGNEGKGILRRGAEAVIDSPTLPIAGGVIGSLAGGGVASIPGAALGGAAGESFRQLGARALGMEAPESSKEAAKGIGIEGATQGIGQAVGLGLGKAVPMIPGVKPAIAGVKKTAGDLFQIVTKMKPEDAATLFKNPKAILPSTFEKAKAGWRNAAKAIGIPVDDVSPEIIKAIKDDAKKTVFDTFEKITAGEAVSAAEAQIANQALRIGLKPAAKNERNAALIAMYDKMGDVFRKRIGAESKEMALANKDYAIGKVGKKFRSLFPRNLNDSPAYFRSSVLPSLFTGAGAFRGDPLEGALQGAGVAAASSPLAIGSLIALIGSMRGGAPLVGRTATAALADLAKKHFQRE